MFLIYLILKSRMIDNVLFSLILGGALGNVYDRLTYYAVQDFIDIHYKNFHWFTFNAADIFISIGVITLILSGLALKIFASVFLDIKSGTLANILIFLDFL